MVVVASIGERVLCVMTPLVPRHTSRRASRPPIHTNIKLPAREPRMAHGVGARLRRWFHLHRAYAPRRDELSIVLSQPAGDLDDHASSFNASAKQQHLWWDGRKTHGANRDERMVEAWHAISHKPSRRALSNAHN